MAESILGSVKKALGVPVDETAFDAELMLHINSQLSTLRQLGVGPANGFMIADSMPTWDDFLGDKKLKMNDAMTYVFFRVKIAYDPPPTSFVLDAMKEQIKEAEWRLNVSREETDWVDPDPVALDPEATVVIDGGYADPTLF